MTDGRPTEHDSVAHSAIPCSGLNSRLAERCQAGSTLGRSRVPTYGLSMKRPKQRLLGLQTAVVSGYGIHSDRSLYCMNLVYCGITVSRMDGNGCTVTDLIFFVLQYTTVTPHTLFLVQEITYIAAFLRVSLVSSTRPSHPFGKEIVSWVFTNEKNASTKRATMLRLNFCLICHLSPTRTFCRRSRFNTLDF